MKFAVIGDTHYVRRESHREFALGNEVREGSDLWRYVRMNEHVLPSIMEEIKQLEPAFVVHTGDLIQGSGDDEGSVAEMKEALAFMGRFGMPVYYAVGNHDGYVARPGGAAITEALLPALSQTLGMDKLTRGYYAFDAGNCLFIVLDYTTYATGGEQEAFLEGFLQEGGEEFEHIFVFGHPPLVPVVRPFFSDLEYASGVLNLLDKYKVDAYFCGHTHNHIASLHRIGNQWLPQFKSATVAMPDAPPIHVTDIRPLLLPSNQMEFGWGYLEGTAPSWWFVTVDGANVRVDWHVLQRGICGSVLWGRDEKPRFEATSIAVHSRQEFPNQENIRSIRLRVTGIHVSGGTMEDGLYKVYMNGELIGNLPRLGSFTCRETIEVPASLWDMLGVTNEIRVKTAEERMCVGAFVLEVETDTGLFRSEVSPYFANSPEWDKWGIEPLRIIQRGEDILACCSFAMD